MIEPGVTHIHINREKFPLIPLVPKPNKRVFLFAGFGDNGRPIVDDGVITRVYSNGSFVMSDTKDTGLCNTDQVGGAVVGGTAKQIHPSNPRLYDSTYRFCVAGA
jgi:hypothetical protein